MSYIGKTPTSVPLTSSDITDGIISTDKLAANAVVTSKITDATISNADVNATLVTGQTAETSIADGDTILIHDASASALRKMTKANFVSGVGGANSDLFLAIKTSNQAISTSTTTALTYDTERYDTGNNFASNAYTVPSDGYYYLYAKITVSGEPAAGRFGISIMKGSTTIADCQNGSAGAAFNSMGTSIIVALSANDVIDVDCRQTTGSTENVYGGSWNTTVFGGYKLNT